MIGALKLKTLRKTLKTSIELMIMFQVVQAVLSLAAFPKTELTFCKKSSVFADFRSIGRFRSITSFSLVVSHYKTNEKN